MNKIKYRHAKRNQTTRTDSILIKSSREGCEKGLAWWERVLGVMFPEEVRFQRMFTGFNSLKKKNKLILHIDYSSTTEEKLTG